LLIKVENMAKVPGSRESDVRERQCVDQMCLAVCEEATEEFRSDSMGKTMKPKESASEAGMVDAASDWTKAWQIIAQALKEMRAPDCDNNARAIIARLAQQNMLIVRSDNVKE